MWDYDSLYKKAKEFVHKGLEHQDPSSNEVLLWCIMALELLARATLSNKNPALLVDLRNEDSLRSACGVPAKKTPTSAPANVIFSRCVAICDDFTEEHLKRCLSWLGWRNEELHTGSSPFENIRTSDWRPEYFRICSILLSENKLNLKDFIGKPQAEAAHTIIDSLDDQKKKEAHDQVYKARLKFREREAEDQAIRLQEGSARAKKVVSTNMQCKEEKCPSCLGRAVLVSDLVRSTTPVDSDGELVQEDVWLPFALVCYCCDLKLAEHAHVAAVGFGNQYSTTDILDPIDYYGIDPQDYLDEAF